MKTDTKGIDRNKAKKIAMNELAMEIGNIPRLGEGELEEESIVFPVLTKYPQLILSQNEEKIEDLRFLSENQIGEIKVDRETGEIKRTDVHEMSSNIRKQKQEIKEAVNKALVKSSASKFSRLPFSEHRFTPIQDLLSSVIMEKKIDIEEFESMKEADRENYYQYLDILEDLNLLRVRNEQVEADDILIEIERREDKLSKKLESAMAHFFEEGIDHMDVIKQILGPYLIISGRYYFRALELGSMPEITEEEFEDELMSKYSGRDMRQKSFKLPRYLLQLEQVGLLESEDGGNSWKGNQEVKESLLRQADISEVSEVFA